MKLLPMVAKENVDTEKPTIVACGPLIDDELFANCTSLANIYIPNSVTKIGYDAFYRCENLTSVRLTSS